MTFSKEFQSFFGIYLSGIMVLECQPLSLSQWASVVIQIIFNDLNSQVVAGSYRFHDQQPSKLSIKKENHQKYTLNVKRLNVGH